MEKETVIVGGIAWGPETKVNELVHLIDATLSVHGISGVALAERVTADVIYWLESDSGGPHLPAPRAEHEVAADIAARIRANYTASANTYAHGGDFLVEAVADWIENPPEWVDVSWRKE
jgi:hypothetical protein